MQQGGDTRRSVAQFSKFRRFARRFPAGCGGFRKWTWNGWQNVQQNLHCGSSALENPPGDMSKMQIFHSISFKMLWWRIKRERDGEGSWVVPEQYDGSAPISILIVHKFQVKVSVCTARWRWGCGSSPAYNISLLSHFNGLDDGTSAHLGFIQPKQVWLTASGWKLHYMLARFQIWNCPGNIF